MKKKKTRLKFFILFFTAILIIFLFLITKNLLNQNLDTLINFSENSNLENQTTISINNSLNINSNQTKKENNNNNCTWKLTSTQITTLEFVKKIDYENETIYNTKQYNYELISEPIREIKKTINDESIQAFTFYKKNNFQEFYNSIKITGWFYDSKIATYEANNSQSEIIIKNNDNIEAEYRIYRLYPTVENENYIDLKPTFKDIQIKKDKELKIVFDNSILCYNLEKNENYKTTMDYYKEFRTKNKLNNDDFIIFDFNNEFFSCIRPYFAIIPKKYREEKIIQKEIDNSYYEPTKKTIEKYTCS